MGVFHRIKFHISMCFRSLCMKVEDIVHPRSDQDILDEFESCCAAVSPKVAEDIERTLREHRDNEPGLESEKTMLIHSRPEEHSCSTFTAASYRQKILNAVTWGKQHGITAFLADYATPLGLLALETLVELRKQDNSFCVYAVKSLPITMRKTYRAIPETGAELAILASRADYSYHLMPEETIFRVLANASVHCSERGLWFAKGSTAFLSLD